MSYKYRVSDALAGEVGRYQRKRASGQSAARMHEDLYRRISHDAGEVTAEFFDKESALPPVTWGLLPWPMTHFGREMFQKCRIGAAAIGGASGLFIGGQSGPELGFALAVVFGALAMVVFHIISVWAKPRDIADRSRQVATYEAMLRDQQRQEESEAERRREDRLLGEYEA